ncbi:HNH endonuclease [Aquihabitans sp. G128]|uniref:HNH endonuclease signature motif containing protein n=1 Tax=Aquihabitans sp. G128 TaxID=2849779 RepID=UPI001C21AAE5|nr:HNH endonuclease signature motif containing protein [Aquihabitans sp. G128]QXC63022.1 HNH endonuclease [Aquihabitans sp. G128]
MRTRTDRDGAFCLNLRGPAADGVRLLSLLRPYEEQAFRTGRTDGIRDTFENRSYDAFQAFLADLQASSASADRPAPASGSRPAQPAATGSAAPGSAASASTGPDPAAPPESAASGASVRGRTGADAPTPPLASAEPAAPDPMASAAAPPGPGAHGRQHAAPARVGTGDRPAGPVRARPPGGNNVKVIVRIDHSALVRGHTVAGETCEVAGVGPISAGAVRELLRDDPFLAAVVTKGRDVVTVAHLGRGLNAHQRTAIEALGLRCANRACNRTVALQIDHRVPYAQVPETRLDNQDPLCPDCHRRKTHHGWHLEPGTGPRRFLPPDEPPGRQSLRRTEQGTGPLRDPRSRPAAGRTDQGTGSPEVGERADSALRPRPGTHQPSLL